MVFWIFCRGVSSTVDIVHPGECVPNSALPLPLSILYQHLLRWGGNNRKDRLTVSSKCKILYRFYIDVFAWSSLTACAGIVTFDSSNYDFKLGSPCMPIYDHAKPLSIRDNHRLNVGKVGIEYGRPTVSRPCRHPIGLPSLRITPEPPPPNRRFRADDDHRWWATICRLSVDDRPLAADEYMTRRHTYLHLRSKWQQVQSGTTSCCGARVPSQCIFSVHRETDLLAPWGLSCNVDLPTMWAEFPAIKKWIFLQHRYQIWRDLHPFVAFYCHARVRLLYNLALHLLSSLNCLPRLAVDTVYWQLNQHSSSYSALAPGAGRSFLAVRHCPQNSNIFVVDLRPMIDARPVGGKTKRNTPWLPCGAVE